ncbi:helix-turn-helix domain-containing protein [Aureibaculum sp. 2210JD6-5]|uniref:AraC family transcriptional regulator n=1 Tax=Aureibaculum sp. 2210JD6-5 TaxID=3103957 RepID=UPI002AAE4E4F|nr:helix-turn-helix domain-containing protein [Aureibaculum sp. 2210JD6-5]MDY7393787.1 helix-turn-helix domain-containing protein [Aureibaculum sp. 2210JD6-5]
MEELKNIKNFYKPIQPTVKYDDKEILYRELQPDNEIENFVYSFWQLKTLKKLKTPFLYRVVSDGCIDIFFDHKKPSENFVMGFCRKYTEFAVGKDFDYIGIRFLPAAFPLLFGINAKTLINQSQKLKHILPKFSSYITSEIKTSQPFEKVIELLTNGLKESINIKVLYFDPRLFNSLKVIFQKKGFLDIEKDIDTGVSPRQLRRIFNYYIGTTAKSFSDVVRFQHILNATTSNQNFKENKIYFDVGFYDQAHFTKNFKTFYGVTPSEAFR